MADANATADPHQSPLVKRAKRTRVLLACQRCKSREQKCDGSQPKCATCNRLDLECRYVLPSHPKPQEARMYIKSLENRVAELEMCLARGGQSDAALDHLTSYQNPSDGESVEKVEVFSLLSTVRDLSLNTSGSYIGGTSTITLARILESVVGRTDQSQLAFPTSTWTKAESPPQDLIPSEDDCISPGSASSTAASFRMQPDVGDKLVEAYLRHVSTNFIVLHSAQIKDLHKRRNSLNDPCEESILHLIYSLGAQYLESTQSGESGNYHWRYHFEVALGNRDKILQLGDTRTLKYLLLLVQHCLRIPRHPGAWTFSGIAMRLCVELGLHRRKRSRLQPNLQSELEKRLFWACYYMDRESSIALGRPPCISDHDIDIPLPLDVEEENQDVDVFRRAVESNSPSNPPTTMTVYIHILRLKRIESEIQHTIYRVDGYLASNMSQETDQFLERLAAWRNAIPSQSHDHSLTTYMVAYHKCVRLLLQPQLYESVINERYLTLCTQACSGVCETYRRLHDTQPVAFSTLSLQSVFLAGVTLVYCLWHAPSSTSIRYMSSLSDCRILLYIMTERWPVIHRYRDSFEAIKHSVLHLISEDKHQPGKAIPVMPADVRSTLQGLEVNMTENINRDDLEHMIEDMTGESLAFWNQVNMDLSFPVDEELQFLGDLNDHRDHGSGNGGTGELNLDWIHSIDGRFLNSGMLNSGMVVGWDGDGS